MSEKTVPEETPEIEIDERAMPMVPIPKMGSKDKPEEQRIVEVQLDKPRTLIWDFNAMTLIKKKTGKNPMKGEFQGQSVHDMRLFFWACLVHEDPALTVEQVGAYLYIHQFREALSIMLRLMTNADLDKGALAPYVPTPPELIDKALELAELAVGESFLDLGCGDGRTVHKAAKICAKAIGVEKHDSRVGMARDLIKTSKYRAKADILQQDILSNETFDLLPGIDVVFVYLLQESNAILRPIFEQKLKPGSRVVSLDFSMEGWKPATVEVIEHDNRKRTIFVYKIGDTAFTPVANPEDTIAQAIVDGSTEALMAKEEEITA
jgi:SAM-dependent methyltransferase